MDDIQRHINEYMHRQNNQGLPRFEGYSPIEVEYLLRFPLEPNSPIVLLKGADSDYNKIPILNQVKYLLNQIHESNGMKLTKAGYLPTKLVTETMRQNFLNLEVDADQDFITKKEMDSPFIHLTVNLMTISGLVKKRNGTISLTNQTKKVLNHNAALFRKIFEAFMLKYNWSYQSWGYEGEIGQLGFGYTLILLSKYGNTYRPSSFYAEKYFTAFPDLLKSVNPIYGTVEEFANDIYRSRSFLKYSDYFNLFDVQDNEDWKDRKVKVKKSVVFERLIKCEIHKERPSPFAH